MLAHSLIFSLLVFPSYFSFLVRFIYFFSGPIFLSSFRRRFLPLFNGVVCIDPKRVERFLLIPAHHLLLVFFLVLYRHPSLFPSSFCRHPLSFFSSFFAFLLAFFIFSRLAHIVPTGSPGQGLFHSSFFRFLSFSLFIEWMNSNSFELVESRPTSV